jgi:hypothetical protein
MMTAELLFQTNHIRLPTRTLMIGVVWAWCERVRETFYYTPLAYHALSAI